MRKIILGLAALALIGGGAYYTMHKMHHHEHAHHHDHKMNEEMVILGDLTITQAIAKATPKGAPVGAGYLTIQNKGNEADVLLSGTLDFADHLEVHEMKMNDNVMQMRKLGEGLTIPAGGEVVLKPGGFHLMFMQMKEQLKADEKRKITLNFQRAGEITVNFLVVDMKGGHKH